MGLRALAVWVAGLVLLSGCAAGVEGGSRFVAQGPALPLPSEPLAEVDVATFEGILVGLRGKPVVVNLWASWCGPCEAEAPLLERAWVAASGRTTFLGVDAKDGSTAAAKFIERHGLNYPNVADPSGEVARALGSRGLPTTYIFDATGRLKATVTGAITEQLLAGHLKDLET